MKKQARKLNLNKETLRNLEEAGLNGVLGGSGQMTCISCVTSCTIPWGPKPIEDE